MTCWWSEHLLYPSPHLPEKRNITRNTKLCGAGGHAMWTLQHGSPSCFPFTWNVPCHVPEPIFSSPGLLHKLLLTSLHWNEGLTFSTESHPSVLKCAPSRHRSAGQCRSESELWEVTAITPHRNALSDGSPSVYPAQATLQCPWPWCSPAPGMGT